jgi:hypothetical protein
VPLGLQQLSRCVENSNRETGEDVARLCHIALCGHADVLQVRCGCDGRRWRGGEVQQEGRG